METYIHDTDLELTGLSRKIFVTAMNLGASIYTGHMANALARRPYGRSHGRVGCSEVQIVATASRYQGSLISEYNLPDLLELFVVCSWIKVSWLERKAQE